MDFFVSYFNLQGTVAAGLSFVTSHLSCSALAGCLTFYIRVEYFRQSLFGILALVSPFVHGLMNYLWVFLTFVC